MNKRELAINVLETNKIPFNKNTKNIEKLMEKMKDADIYDEFIERMDELDDDSDDEDEVVELDFDSEEEEVVETPIKEDKMDLLTEAFSLGIAIDPSLSADEMRKVLDSAKKMREFESTHLAKLKEDRMKKTVRLLGEAKKVQIFVATDTLNPKDTHVSIWINGVKYRMKRGMSHIVPEPVASVYMESLSLTQEALAKIKFQSIDEE